MLWSRISIRARCTTLCDKVCQWIATGRWFSPGTPVSSTYKIDRHDIAEILLKVALNTIKQTNKRFVYWIFALFWQSGMFCFSFCFTSRQVRNGNDPDAQTSNTNFKQNKNWENMTFQEIVPKKWQHLIFYTIIQSIFLILWHETIHYFSVLYNRK